MRFSASRLKKWQQCALAAHYHYDERLPTKQSGKASFGSSIHRALQHYNLTGDYEGAVEIFKAMWDDLGAHGLEPDYWPKGSSWAPLKKKGLEILEATHDLHRFSDRTVLAAEHKFLVPFGEHELTGVVDLVEVEQSATGARLTKVVDYKTNTKLPTVAELALDPQLTTYAYAVQHPQFWFGVEGDPDFPPVENAEWHWEMTVTQTALRAIWYSLWSQKLIDAGPRTEVDFQRMYRLCNEIARADELGVHVPRIGEACQWCDFQDACALEIPVAIAQATDPDDRNRWI